MTKTLAVIFDLDGLMIDTENLGFQIYQDILKPYNTALEEHHFNTMVGLDAEAANQYVIDVTHIPLDSAALSQQYWLIINKRIAAELDPNPGLLPLIAELKKRGYPLAVASNSPTDYVQDTLAVIHLKDAFNNITGRDQVEQGKPAPDLYLAAARALEVPASGCLAVEDSPVGMHSALVAGMRCAIVNGRWADPSFARASFRCSSLGELHAALDKIL